MTGEYLLLAPLDVSRRSVRNEYVPGSDGLNLADRVVTPVCQALKLPPGSIRCTSNTYVPVGAAVAHVIVKLVPTPPDIGLAFIGTFTVPFMRVGWMEQ